HSEKPGSASGCVTGRAQGFGPLGAIAYLKGDSLHLLDPGSGRDQLLVAGGVSLPIRWSPDGAWIAFEFDRQTVGVIPASGGRVCEPMGKNVLGWLWSP